MQSQTLVSSFAEIAREKDIDRDTLQVIIEDVFRAMIKKRYGADDSFEIIFNPDHGDIQIIHVREVVDDFDVEDPVTQIEEDDALKIDEDYEVGDEVAVPVSIDDFGRRAVQTALQTFRQRIRDIEKEHIHQEYSEIIGEIVVGEIYQTRRREVLVIHNKTELVLQKEGQIYKDRYRKGDMLRAVVESVDRDAGASPQVVISRTAPVFVERLFELEVPEIYDGVVEIKDVVREPGDRAKVAVVSHDDRVDPVGACVGVKGSRIHAVVRELGNENIDVIPWTTDTIEYIKRALAPAKPIAVELHEELSPPRARVTVPTDEVSMAIGRGGQNIRLASKLTGYELDVYRDIRSDEEDVDIEEFRDAIPAEIIQRLKNIGCDTAKAVLELSADELARRTELPKETAQKITVLMQAEFADAGSTLELPSGETVTVGGDAAIDLKIDESEVASIPETQPESAAAPLPEGDAEDGAAPAIEDAAEPTNDAAEPVTDGAETPLQEGTPVDLEEAVPEEQAATEEDAETDPASEQTPA